MGGSKKISDPSRSSELELSSSFCRRIYSEVEEVGWEHLVRLDKDFTSLTFRVEDKTGRAHILEITLHKAYPRYSPSVSADVPYNFNLQWSKKSKLKNAVQQFQEHLNNLQDFWSVLDEIDRSLWVTDPKQPHFATPHRQINIGNDCYIVLSVSAAEPLSLPECRFLGPDPEVNSLKEIWKRNCSRWMKNKPFVENLADVLGSQLPKPPHVQRNEDQIECGICYAQCLPVDDELGAKSGGETDYTCENVNCNRSFHIVCLWDWLHSITTTRRSFDVLFGNCPYCSDPMAVKISTSK